MVRRKRGKKIIESMCFFPKSTRRFSSQNREKTVKKTGPIIWTKMSLQRSSLLVLLNIFLSFFSLFSINVQSFYYLLFIYFLGTVQRSIPNQLDFWLFILFLLFFSSIFLMFFFFFLLHLFWVLFIYIYINGMSIHSSIHNFFNKNIVYYFLFFIGHVSKFI